MKLFLVSVEGRNFWLTFDGGRPARTGFFATRMVESETPEAAKTVAIDMIRSELRASEWYDDAFNEQGTIAIERVRMLTEPPVGFANSGFTFFREKLDA